jgi:hypothetical protein
MLAVIVFCLPLTSLAKAQPTKPLDIYIIKDRSHVTSTIDPIELGIMYVKDYEIVGRQGWILSTPKKGTIPLELYWRPKYRDAVLLAKKESKIEALKLGYQRILVEGHVYSQAVKGTKAVKWLFHKKRQKSISAVDDDIVIKALKDGFELMGIEGYVLVEQEAILGRSSLISNVHVNGRQFCPGEEVVVEVTTKHPEDPGKWVNVVIQGYPGNKRYFYFEGEPGKRFIQIVASTEDGYSESKIEEVTIKKCRKRPFHKVRARINPYHPYTVDFLIVNRENILPGTDFYWTFGNLISRITDVPYISHNFEDQIDGSKPYDNFLISVTDGRDHITTNYNLAIQNNYYSSKKKGIIYPPANTNGRLEDRGRWMVGTFSLKNLENEPVLFTRAIGEYQYCDRKRISTYFDIAPADVIFQGNEEDEEGGEEPETPTPPDTPTVPTIPTTRTVTSGKMGTAGNTIRIPEGPLAISISPAKVSKTAKSSQNPALKADSMIVSPSLNPGKTKVMVVPDQSVIIDFNQNDQSDVEGFVLIPGRHTHQGFFSIRSNSIPDNVCGLGYHLIGRTNSGLEVHASLYYEVKTNPLYTEIVVEQAFKDFLNELINRGMVTNPNEISEQDLYRLEQEGKIRRTVHGWEFIN